MFNVSTAYDIFVGGADDCGVAAENILGLRVVSTL
jgi:hypothetical protein